MDITFGSLVTPAGIVVSAGAITTLVQLLKSTFPVLDAKLSGALQAFILSAALYVVTGLVLQAASPLTPDAALGIFMAWLTCATSAVGIKSAVTHATEGTA
jgi:hypothetical protein